MSFLITSLCIYLSLSIIALRKLEVGVSPKPIGRAGHQAYSMNEKLFIFGGTNADGVVSDISIFDFDEKVWSQVIDRKIPRYNHNLCFCSTQKLVCIFGGIDDPKECLHNSLNETIIEFNPITYALRYVKNFDKNGEIPKACSDSSIVFHRSSERIIRFGGWNMNWSNNVEYLDV